jgi:peptidoglycan-N-acetylglucosamine deacetylase
MTSQKSIASLSLDLDNKWSYLKIHGNSDWECFPSYLDVVVPRVLDFLSQRGLTITFFIVGQDVALEKNHEALRAISARGHEIGNHSFSHEPWLHLYSHQKTEEEIATAEEYITEVMGQRPVGFRGPGFSLSSTALEVLARRGYLYDASTFPTFLGPLARLYYLLHSDLSREELKQRGSLFGSIRDGWRPLKPYRWRHKGLLEIPVTTMPILRLPIHMSYILYLSIFSSAMALAYFKKALLLCRLTGVFPSLLLHPLDFLGQDDHIGLEFFPAMKLDRRLKLHVLGEALKIYGEEFRITSVREHAQHVGEAENLIVMEHYAEQSAPPPHSRKLDKHRHVTKSDFQARP